MTTKDTPREHGRLSQLYIRLQVLFEASKPATWLPALAGFTTVLVMCLGLTGRLTPRTASQHLGGDLERVVEVFHDYAVRQSIPREVALNVRRSTYDVVHLLLLCTMLVLLAWGVYMLCRVRKQKELVNEDWRESSMSISSFDRFKYPSAADDGLGIMEIEQRSTDFVSVIEEEDSKISHIDSDGE